MCTRIRVIDRVSIIGQWLILLTSSYLFCADTASAEITIDGRIVHVETDNYEVQIENGEITHIHNKLTDETYTLPTGRSGWTGLLNHQHYWRDVNISARNAQLISAQKISPHNAELVFRQDGTNVRLLISVDPATDDLLIDVEGVSDTPGVIGMQWGISYLDLHNLSVIAPVDGGRIIDATTPSNYISSFYPGSGLGWETQLAIVQGERGGFLVRNTDDTFQFKHFIYDRQGEEFALHFNTHNQAPFDSWTTAKSQMWRFNTYASDWRVPARIYRDWMEKTFNPRRLSDMPAWVENISLFVGSPFSNIGLKNIPFLDKLAEQVDPTKTLLLVKEWATGRDWWRPGLEYIPDYKPQADLGPFIEAARRHGFRVMLYMNLIAMSPDHPLYPEFQKFQLRDTWSGELIGWHWNTTHPHRHAFINPASSAFRKIIVQELRSVWQQYSVDGFFLDVSHFVKNDANGLIDGLNSAQGMALLHKELADAMPGAVFGGERLHEVTFFRESFAQRPLLSFSAPAEPHPISAFLFSPYTHAIGFLPNPDESIVLYQQHMRFHESWGVLPTLEAWSANQLGADRFETQRLLSIARTWQQFGLKPDFESDWDSDTVFQYIGQNSEIATFQRTPTGSILTLPEDSVGYESVYSTTQVRTDRSLPGWYAYDETGLLGLNPDRSYFLSDTPRDLSQPRINALPESVLVTEARVTENAALFRLNETDVSYDIDLSTQFDFVRTGIEVNGTDSPLQKGATFRPVETTISGVRKKAIDAHPPWREGIRGNTFGEWTFTLPDSPSIRFAFDIGLLDGATLSDGVTFIVSIQGDEIFSQHHTEQRWQHVELDLTRYRGQRVILRLTTTPGPNGHPGQDWAYWGEPKIVSDPVASQIGFFLPRQPIKSFPDTVRHIGGGQYILETELPAQVLFLFEPTQQVVPPHKLWETPFVTGLQLDGIFLYGRSAWGSGMRRQSVVTGVPRQIITAHPPEEGKTVIQFLLSLPEAREITFSFLMRLTNPCTTGVTFQVLVNGQTQFEHATSLVGATDAQLSLSEFAGEVVLLELITDSDGHAGCDASDWSDLLITAEAVEANGDVNQDGDVNVLDLILITQSFGTQPPDNPQADVNSDGVVNVMDLVFVVKRFSQNAAAPGQVERIKSTAEQIIAIQRAVRELETMPNKSQHIQLAIELLRRYLSIADRNVQETKLLPNYPNPFNPETWIPYQLSEESTVTVKIYDVGGHLVRTIEAGLKPMGYYLTRERSVYWDGRNEDGERISSGIYFYTLNASDYTETRRLMIVK